MVEYAFFDIFKIDILIVYFLKILCIVYRLYRFNINILSLILRIWTSKCLFLLIKYCFFSSQKKRLYTRTDGIYFEISLVYLHIATRLTLMNIRTSISSHLFCFWACLAPRKRKWNEKPTNLNAKSYAEGLQGHLCNN